MDQFYPQNKKTCLFFFGFVSCEVFDKRVNRGVGHRLETPDSSALHCEVKGKRVNRVAGYGLELSVTFNAYDHKETVTLIGAFSMGIC